MKSAIDEIIDQITEDCAEQMKIEDVRQKTSSLGKDEWYVVLKKITHILNSMSRAAILLDDKNCYRLRVIVAILSSFDVGETNFRERDELAESIGTIINSCQNSKIQKSFVELLIGWVKKDWLISQSCLYGLLKFQCHQVRSQRKVADIKNLALMLNIAAYAVRCSNDESFVKELCAVGVHPNVFQSPEGKKFTFKLYEQAPHRMHEQMKIMLSSCDRKLGKALGELYYRCVTTFRGEVKEKFMQDCLQDFAYWCLCMKDENLSSTLIEAMIFINKKLRLTKTGSDDLFDIYAPFLMKMTEVPNSVFRIRASRLLFTAYPLTSSKASEDENRDSETKQLAAFERLLEDNVPSVRAASIAGLCELSSCIAEALPIGWLQKVMGKVFVRLAYDNSSPDVRLACVKGLGRLVENHVLWPLTEKLFSDVKYLFHDKSHLVRAAFAQLMDKIAKLRAFKPWKYLQSRADFLPRLAMDDATVCRPLTSLLLDYYLPADKDAVSHLDTLCNLVDFNAIAARNFYRIAVTHLTFVRASALLDILLRHLAMKSATLIKKMEIDGGDDTTVTMQTMADNSVVDNASITTMVEKLLKLTEVAAACWLALLPQMKQTHNSNTARDLERLAASALPRIFKLCEHFHKDASNVVMFASCLPWRVVPVIFQKTVGFLRRPGAEEEHLDPIANDLFRQTSSVAIKALTNWAKLSELLHIIHETVREGVAALRKKSASVDTLEESKRRSNRKRVRFDKTKVAVKEHSGAPSAAGDLETHLGLLDILLRNRSCVRQLRGKDSQIREIWEELMNSLDLIGNAALSGAESLSDADKKLLLCFEFYCRLGLLLHVDMSKTPVIVDDSFLKQLSKWLREHTGIFAGSNANALTEFQVSLCRIYLKQLTTRIMLNAVVASTDSNDSVSSGLSPSDIFEMALDATAFIPNGNRIHLAEAVLSLVYASVVKLATINSQLTTQERSEHMRLLISYLTALDESNIKVSASTLVHCTDCFVLLALLCKKAEKGAGRNESENERIAEGFSRLVSIVVKNIDSSEPLMEGNEESSQPQEKRRPISKNPEDASYLFNVVFSRFFPAAVRGIFSSYLALLEQKIPPNELIRASVARWLVNIGYGANEIPPSFVQAAESEKTISAENPESNHEVNENSMEAS